MCEKEFVSGCIYLYQLLHVWTHFLTVQSRGEARLVPKMTPDSAMSDRLSFSLDLISV